MQDEAEAFDLLIVGGGIVGAGLAREAALRGKRVALLEKDDYAAGTTSRSTRLIHGGLRYLEQFDFSLVREALRERKILLEQAPHLVRPLAFLLPVYKGRGSPLLWIWAGMLLYDGLSLGKRLPHHRILGRRDCLEREPALVRKGLRGGFLYYDAQCAFPERLCLETVLDAQTAGATVRNHTEVTGLILEDGAAVGVRARDTLDGAESQWRAKTIVNATGPWIEDFLARAGHGARRRLTRSKGVHLVTPAFARHALILQSQDAKRVIFAIPWGDYTLVGTTDTAYDGANDGVATDDADVAYLVEETRRVFDVELAREDVLLTTAGLRALPYAEGRAVGQITRRHVLVDHAAEGGPRGLWSVVGGKITTYRAIASDVADALLGKARSPTRTRPLPGGSRHWPRDRATWIERAKKAGLDSDSAEHVVDHYGARTRLVLDAVAADAEAAMRLDPARPEVLAQVDVAVHHEQARTLVDVLLRRTTLGLSQGGGMAALEATSIRMARVLGWDEARRKQEEEAYAQRIARMGPHGGRGPINPSGPAHS